MKKRPYLLTIAGFDPSSGAGLTADVKTMEQLKCYGLAVCTANTVQNDVHFKNCYWVGLATMLSQIEILFARFTINVVKIGIVENWQILSVLVDKLLTLNPAIKIILDPVLTSSSNYNFKAESTKDTDQIFDAILDKIYLLTPNYNEIEQLYPHKNIEDTLKHISLKTNVFLKGGHHPKTIGVDVLYMQSGKQFKLAPKLLNCSAKHGSGCVLSSSIASYIALKYPLLKACYKGKRYTEKVLASNKTLLGTHLR